MLARTARVLVECLPDWVIARIGADHFVAVGPAPSDDLLATADLVRDAIRDLPDLLGETSFSLSANVGVRHADASGPEQLLNDARLATEVGKSAGGDRTTAFDVEMRVQTLDLRDMVLGLPAAFERDELVVHHQPIVDLDSGRIVGSEALVRWRRPDGELLGPDRFLHLVARSGRSDELADRVLQLALADAAPWIRAQRDFVLSVNIAAEQLWSPGFAGRVLRSCRQHGVDPARIQLEITETTAIGDATTAGETLAGLRSAGVRIAVDDFGTGWSSLDDVRNLPVDALKIDRSFTAGLAERPRDAEIVSFVVHLADRLGLGVVIEGIETDAQRLAAQRLGCRTAQGYHFGRPVPAEVMAESLAQRA